MIAPSFCSGLFYKLIEYIIAIHAMSIIIIIIENPFILILSMFITILCQKVKLSDLIEAEVIFFRFKTFVIDVDDFHFLPPRTL